MVNVKICLKKRLDLLKHSDFDDVFVRFQPHEPEAQDPELRDDRGDHHREARAGDQLFMYRVYRYTGIRC